MLSEWFRKDQGERVMLVAQQSDGRSVNFDASWVAGYDGTRSKVGQSAPTDFVRVEGDMYGWLADVVLAQPPAKPLSVHTKTGSSLLQTVPRWKTSSHRGRRLYDQRA